MLGKACTLLMDIAERPYTGIDYDILEQGFWPVLRFVENARCLKLVATFKTKQNKKKSALISIDT